MDPAALYVVSRLQKKGHTAYLVGGSVRDLLLGLTPKDFDVATSATPEAVRAVFGRSARIIGKRFRLVHVYVKDKTIEVATFRSGCIENEILIQRDNQWGSEEEDAMRRDFTINGLFFDPASSMVVDYVGGYQDLQSQVLRTIGSPERRFKQDPVRMIRLLKFHVRMGLRIESETLHALKKCIRHIRESAPARVLEELFRILESGWAAPMLEQLCRYSFLETLMPCLHAAYCTHRTEIQALLKGADQCQNTPLRYALFAALIFPSVKNKIEGTPSHPCIKTIELISTQCAYEATLPFKVPRRLKEAVGEAILMQYRLAPHIPQQGFRPPMAQKEFFQEALSLLEIRQSAPNASDREKHAYDTFKALKASSKAFTKKVERGCRKGKYHPHRRKRGFQKHKKKRSHL